MKKAYQCDTCKGFNFYNKPTKCPVCDCDNEMCDECANDFLCPTCFSMREQGLLKATPLYEGGDLVGWERWRVTHVAR